MELAIAIFTVTMVALGISIKCNLSLARKLSEEKHECLIQHGIVSNLDMGFYLWDSVKRTEHISLKRSKKSLFFSFEKFANQFNEADELKRELALAKSKSHMFTMTLSSKNKKIHFQCQGGSIQNRVNKIVGAVIFFKDNSQEIMNNLELDNKVSQLKTNSQMLSDIVSNSPYLIWVRDKDLNIKFCNPAAEHAEIPYNEKTVVQQAIITGRFQTDRVTLFIEGKKKLFQVTENSTATGSIGYAHSIEQLAYLETRLARFLKDRNFLLKTLPTAVTIYSAGNKLIFFNTAFQKLFDFKRNWLETKPRYQEVMDLLNKKLVIVNRDPDLNNILIPRSRIISLMDRRNIHINILPSNHGETIITYDTIKPQQSDTHKNSEAYALFLHEDGIVGWNQELLELFNLELGFLQTRPKLETILEQIKDVIITNQWEQTQERLVQLLREQGFLEIKTRTCGNVICRCKQLSDQHRLIAFSHVHSTQN